MAMPIQFDPSAFRTARRAAGLTQSEAARRIGAAQSAISMFEGGRTDALADDKLHALAHELGLDLESPQAGQAASPACVSVARYCPVQDCPSNIPYMAGGALCVHASTTYGTAGRKAYCAHCGELLEDRCPNIACSAPVREGAFCVECGAPYVVATLPPGVEPDAYAARRRKVLSALRELFAGDPSGRIADPPTSMTNKEF